MGWLDHKAVQIIKGVGKTPGDPYSAEPDPIVVNLMSGIISLTEDGWTPEVASVKNGGVWSDSPLSDGRQLLAAPAGNVTEKIVVYIADSTYLGVQTQLSALNLMVTSCRDYWQSEAQVDPVYLRWFASCAPDAQYALLSNIELTTDYLDSPAPSIRVTITLEREPFWRAIAPGDNPKKWAYYINASNPQFNYNVASLVSGSDHFITETIHNKHEWNGVAYGLQVNPPLSNGGIFRKNYIDITAAQVPGDAPALVEMQVAATNNFLLANAYIGRSSKKMTGTGHDGITRSMALNLNCGDATAGTGAITSGSGVVSNGATSPTAEYHGLRTTTGIDGSWLAFSRWGVNTGGRIKLDRQMYRGTYAIFARCYNNSAASPVTTDMKIRVTIDEFEDATNQYLATYTSDEGYPPITQPGLVYLGVVTLPLENRAVQSPLGYGTQLQESNSNLRITLEQQVLVATANRSMYGIDVIFMPIDEGLAQVNLVYTSGFAGSDTSVIFDNTGYLSRGDNQQSAVGYVTNANSGGVSQELKGADIMLLPRTNQRLYFLFDWWANATTLFASTGSTAVIRLNIVPRWAGIRDV